MLPCALAAEGMYHGWESPPRAAELVDCINSAPTRRKMFGTLTLIKRNGSEGSTMTMDSRETTIGR